MPRTVQGISRQLGRKKHCHCVLSPPRGRLAKTQNRGHNRVPEESLQESTGQQTCTPPTVERAASHGGAGAGHAGGRLPLDITSTERRRRLCRDA
jgi:hypothetical protein